MAKLILIVGILWMVVMVRSLVGSPLVKELKRNKKRNDGTIAAQALKEYVMKKDNIIITWSTHFTSKGRVASVQARQIWTCRKDFVSSYVCSIMY